MSSARCSPPPERKRFAIAVHVRQVDERNVPVVEAAVDASPSHTVGSAGHREEGVRASSGREWDKAAPCFD